MLVGAASGYDLGRKVVVADIFHGCGHYRGLVVLRRSYLWILTLHLELMLEFNCVFIFIAPTDLVGRLFDYAYGLILAPGMVKKLRGWLFAHTEFFEAGRV